MKGSLVIRKLNVESLKGLTEMWFVNCGCDGRGSDCNCVLCFVLSFVLFSLSLYLVILCFLSGFCYTPEWHDRKVRGNFKRSPELCWRGLKEPQWKVSRTRGKLPAKLSGGKEQ